MNTRSLLLFLGASAGLLLAGWWFLGRDAERESLRVDPQREAIVPEPPTTTLSSIPQESVDRSELATQAQPVPETAAPEQVAEAEHPAYVIGKLLLPGGTPAVGATLELHGWTANSQRALEFGLPEDWHDIEGIADQEGDFRLGLDPPRAYQFTLAASYPGHGRLQWRWSRLAPTGIRNVGTQTFVRTGTIVGKVLRPDGEPSGDDWTVYGDSSHVPQGEGANKTRVRAPVDPKTGAFRLEDVPPGTAKLKAYSRMSNWIEGPTVVVEEGRETEAKILYEGPDNSTRITVVTFCRPFHIFDSIEELTIRATNQAGREWTAQKIARSSQSYSLEGLENGPFDLFIDSPLHKPWSQLGVSTGQRVNAHLVGSAAIALEVRDASTGEPREGYRLKVRFDGSRWSPNVFEVRGTDDPRPDGGLYEGFIPHATTLIIEAEGYAALELDLGEVGAYETREVLAELISGGGLSGRVLYSSGAPAAGAQVLLHPHYPGYDPNDIFSGPLDQSARARFTSRSHKTTTDHSGAYRFDSLLPGEYDLRASLGALTAAKEQLDLSGASMQVDLKLPAQGSLEGKLLAPAGSDFEGLRICAYPPRISSQTDPFFRETTGVQIVEIGPEGAFRLDDLAAEAHVVELMIPPRRIPSSFSSSSNSPTCSLVLETVEVVAGEVLQREFDLGDDLPGRFLVEARLNGEPAAGLVLRAKREDKREHSGGVLDGQGTLELGPLFPGEWSLSLAPLEGAWSHHLPESWALKPGERLSVPVELRTEKGRVRILAANTLAPEAQRTLWIGRAPALRTDDDGWLELDLLPGRYELRLEQGRGSASVALEWTPNGPVLEELVLPE